MQTNLADFVRNTDAGIEADTILRNCVHCGFCTATCPTYQLLGDELDGPRGRIYLIKQVLEGVTPSRATQLHLDRCLTCRSCETTCPSGVQYGRLLDIGRHLVEARVERSPQDRAVRRLLRTILPYQNRFGPMLKFGQALRTFLPSSLKKMTPPRVAAIEWPDNHHKREMLVLNGCVQPSIAPNINSDAAVVLDRLGVRLVSVKDGCCGALSHHLNAPEEALNFIRRNIDACWPYIERGVEAVVSTASGCGVMVKDYGYLLRDDPVYADKAAKLSALVKDISEVLAVENLDAFKPGAARRVAFQSPCSLQHGQKLAGKVEGILTDLGYSLVSVPEAHLCCGSAGTYSLLNPGISKELRQRKLDALSTGRPDVIATANIGCLTHLQSEAEVPVVHWISLLAGS